MLQKHQNRGKSKGTTKRRSDKTVATRRIKGIRTRRRRSVQGEDDQDKKKMIVGRIGEVISTRQRDKETNITRR